MELGGQRQGSGERESPPRGHWWVRAPALRTSAIISGAVLALAGCTSRAGTAAAPAPSVQAPATEATSVAPTPPRPRQGPPDAPDSAPRPGGSPPPDVTQQAAGRFKPQPDRLVTGPTTAEPSPALLPPVIDQADPLAVAQAYVTARLTYRFDAPAGYTAALTAPAFTTPAFAARSTPSAAALARLATAQETSAVQVVGAELEGEAPNSDTTRYVAVICTVTTAYRGGGSTAPAAWTLRLLQAPPGQWRVDGVLSTD